jgi:hypothetical protein
MLMDLFEVLDHEAQFKLDEGDLEALKAELIDGQRVAVDEDGKVLVWADAPSVPSAEFRVPSPPQSPKPQTPTPKK